MGGNKSILTESVEWDIINWSKALQFWDKKVNLNDQDLNCLELGGRSGGLSLWLASKGNRVICSDYENPERKARLVHQQYPFSNRISYEAIDATCIPYENHFDIVTFKSILGGISKNGNIHLKQKTIDEIFKSLKSNGKLLFAENLIASPLHQFLRKRTPWGAYWNYLQLTEINGLFNKFNSMDFRTAGFLGAFGRTEFQRKLLGRLDTMVFERVVSNNMMYIIFGVATKG